MAQDPSTMERTSCMILGGAIHPNLVPTADKEKQERMVDSVTNDIKRMLLFANSFTRGSQTASGMRYTPYMPVSKILLNADIAEEVGDLLKDYQQKLGGNALSIYSEAHSVSYASMDEVRDQVRSYLETDEAENLIVFMTGHGDQDKQLVEESFSIPKPNSAVVENFTDAYLTQDILGSLPDGKKLYLVIHSCHSGGMVNFWQLDARSKWVALFASAEADILADWNADSDGNDGFVNAFCSNATQGKQLNAIAQSILLSLYNVPERRPAFKTTRPSIVAENFLEDVPVRAEDKK